MMNDSGGDDKHDHDDIHDDNVEAHPTAAPSEGETFFLFWRIEKSHKFLFAITSENLNIFMKSQKAVKVQILSWKAKRVRLNFKNLSWKV